MVVWFLKIKGIGETGWILLKFSTKIDYKAWSNLMVKSFRSELEQKRYGYFNAGLDL